MPSNVILAVSSASNIKAGEEFEIEVSIDNQSGLSILSADILITYGTGKLDLISVAKGEIVGPDIFWNESPPGSGSILVSIGYISSILGDSVSGDLLILKFKADDKPSGITHISLTMAIRNSASMTTPPLIPRL